MKINYWIAGKKYYIMNKIQLDLERNGINGWIGINFLKDRRARFIILLRILNNIYRKKPLLFRLVNFYYSRFQRSLCNEVPPSIKLGCPIYLPHPYGIIIHPNASIGNNCTILQQVTIGNNTNKSIDKVAVIGDRVVISAGAKIIGPLTIGDNVIIGANAVVTKSFGSNFIIAGVPAKIINSND